MCVRLKTDLFQLSPQVFGQRHNLYSKIQKYKYTVNSVQKNKQMSQMNQGLFVLKHRDNPGAKWNINFML